MKLIRVKSQLKITLGILLFLLSVGCKIVNKQNKFEGIALVNVDKTYTLNSQISNDSTWLFKFYNHSYVIYKLPKIVFKNSRSIVIGDTINLEFFDPDTTFKYYIVKGSNNYGIEYDNKLKYVKQFSLDSLLVENGLNSKNFEIYELNLGKPDKIERINEFLEIEKYSNEKNTKEDSDSIYRYFDKRLVGINFSLSTLLDKKKRSKLSKSSFINIYQGKDIKDSIIITEFYSEVRLLNMQNQHFLKEIVKRYELDKTE